MLQIHTFASGRVQGVNFRYYTYRKAKQLKLKGYVCNLDDGRVEILAQGHRDDLNKLIEFVKSNPGLSFVTDLRIDWEQAKTKLSEFRIGY